MPPTKSYWVFVDKPTKRVRLHYADCGAAKSGKGMHGHQEAQCWWRGFDSRAAGWDYALAEAHKMHAAPAPCGLCKP